jgi:hypothetical protein
LELAASSRSNLKSRKSKFIVGQPVLQRRVLVPAALSFSRSQGGL